MTLQKALYQKLGPRFDWPGSSKTPEKSLAIGISLLAALPCNEQRFELTGQPFDRILLSLSKLYRRSREVYLDLGGKFIPSLLTSPRSLSSPDLIEPVIEYSPIENEVVWSVSDSIQKKDLSHLLELRTYCTSLFHEQNHRILWPFLPPPPDATQGAALRRYLNFAESLVISTDMALGDELGPRIALLFYWLGVTYDPGTTLKVEGLSKRQYRNYLQATTLATYMTLELYRPEDTEKVIQAMFPNLGRLALRAAQRSFNLDEKFIAMTNRSWQKRFSKVFAERLARPGEEPLFLPENPMENWTQYLLAEKWFEKMGI